MIELGTVWLLMFVLNQGGPAFLTADITMQSFKPQEGMVTSNGKVAFDLRPGKEKVWSDLVSREAGGKLHHQIMILRFDTAEVFRLDPDKKTYVSKPLPDGLKMLEQIRDIYLGGPDGKASARIVTPPKGITDPRTCKQVESGDYTTIFYTDPAKENAVTRVDVSSKKTSFAVMTSLKNVSLAPIPESRFQVPPDFKKE